MQALANTCDIAFALEQSLFRRVHGVIAGYEFVGMLDRRTEDKSHIRLCNKLNRLIAFFEHDGFAGGNSRWR